MVNEPKPFTLYEHYKGGRYIVVVVGTHTETGEVMVTYMSLAEEAKWWIRPLSSWNKPVEGSDIPRFKEIV